ncbi:MAG TPA: YkgJ family cysteine cluster protein [Candidatus Ozemobacteraceae bacterium]|nr:YkgJ family cysteine cluster protein [Candidatus Ozemobacteraceae bacterium]
MNSPEITPETLLPRLYASIEPFTCRQSCTDCCRGIVSLSIPELQRIETYFDARGEPLAAQAIGCPFRTPDGCRVYPVRPFMCRLFGYRFLQASLRSQPSCPHLPDERDGEKELQAFTTYQAFCREHGFVLIGESADRLRRSEAVAENQSVLRVFPELTRFRSWLTGGDQLLPAPR